MHTAAALSEHPLATHAAGECIGALLEAGGPAPDLLALFVTEAQSGAIEDIVAAARRLLSPTTTLGATAVSVLAGSREVEQHSAVAAFALWSDAPGAADRARAVRLVARAGPDGPQLRATEPLHGAAGTLVLVADPFSCPVDAVLARLAEVAPELVVVGGLASAARAPGGNRLALDGELHRDGAVGVLLPPDVAVTPVVSQGCRPIGDPLTVTAAEGNVVRELAGRPALERLLEMVQGSPPEDRALAAEGLHVGRVVDEHRDEFARGDFVIRAVLGADREGGAVAIGDEAPVGSTLQFQVRDAATAHEDLVALLQGRAALGALVFTCNGRGASLFGEPDHDARVVSEAIGDRPVAGMFCAGELGPVGGSNFLHGFTASMALFG